MGLVAIKMPYLIIKSYQAGIIIILRRIPYAILKHGLSLFHATSKPVVTLSVFEIPLFLIYL